MTDAEGDREPTLREVLAAIQAMAHVQGEHTAAIRGLALSQDELHESVTSLSTDVQGLKLDFAAYTELAESRHVETTQALEAIAGHVHGQQHALVQSEARVLSRIDDVQQVVQKLKADLAAHVSDTQVHRDTHGTAA